MKRILYYCWVGLCIIIALPIVGFIFIGAFIKDFFHKLNCKACRVPSPKKTK